MGQVKSGKTVQIFPMVIEKLTKLEQKKKKTPDQYGFATKNIPNQKTNGKCLRCSKFKCVVKGGGGG